MSTFTRLTLQGATHRLDIVVPSDEPMAGLLPGMLQLVRETSADPARPVALVRTTGEAVDLSATADGQQLTTGEVLHVVRADDAPPPPQVADITSATAERLESEPRRWNDAARGWTAAVVLGVVAAVLAQGLVLTGSTIAPLGLLSAAVLVALIAIGGWRVGNPGLLASAVALGLAAPGGFGMALLARLPAFGAACAGLVAVAVILGLAVGQGRKSRGWVAGALLGLIAGSVGVFTTALGIAVPLAAGVTALVALILCGLLPWYALSASGLAALDDLVLEGRSQSRPAVERSLDKAYATLTIGAAATAMPLALGLAVLLAHPQLPWTFALGVCLLLATALRTRAFPLVAQGVVLWAGVAVGALSAVVGLGAIGRAWQLAAVAALVVVTTALALIRPRDQQRARLRRLGDIVESLCVIVSIPLLLAGFGVFADLLKAF